MLGIYEYITVCSQSLFVQLSDKKLISLAIKGCDIIYVYSRIKPFKNSEFSIPLIAILVYAPVNYRMMRSSNPFIAFARSTACPEKKFGWEVNCTDNFWQATL